MFVDNQAFKKIQRFLCLVVICAIPRVVAGETQRYLYGLTCEATIFKLDIVLAKTVLEEELPNRMARLGQLNLFPKQTQPAPDACLTSQALRRQHTFTFYPCAPSVGLQVAGATLDFRVLAFTIPGLRFEKAFAAGNSASTEPYIESIQLGRPKLYSSRDEAGIQVELDVSTFSPRHTQQENRILKPSGDIYLLQLLGNEGIAVANVKLKKLTILSGVPNARDNIYLTPGGLAVLVESQENKAFKLYDVQTGQQSKQINGVLDGADLHFLAISPNGKAIYERYEDDHLRFKFVDLEIPYNAEPVISVVSTVWADEQGHFFADK